MSKPPGGEPVETRNTNARSYYAWGMASSPVLQVKVDPDVLAWLDGLASDWGMTRSAAARVAIRFAYTETLEKEGTPQ